MSTNLLELLNAHLTEDVVSKIANFIGESPKNTGSALGSALPSLLSGLIHKSSDSQGAGILYNLLTQNHDSSLLSNLGASLVGGDVTEKLAQAGGSLLSSIFGNKSEGIANVVAEASGINKTASTSLLGLVMPIVFAVLGKTLKTQQITSASGLVSLLGDQSGFLKNLLPAGLTSILGAGISNIASANTSIPSTNISSPTSSTVTSSTHSSSSLGTTAAAAAVAGLGAAAAAKAVNTDNKSSVSIDKTTSTTSTSSFARDRVADPVPTPVVRERKPVPPPVVEDDDDAGIFGKLLPWLILGSILALGWGIWKNLKKGGIETASTPAASSTVDTGATPAPGTTPSDGSTATPPPTDASAASGSSTEPAASTSPADTTPPTPPTESTASNTPAPASTSASGSAAAFTQKLPSGIEIKASADSMESKLYAFINDAGTKIEKDKWFTMDGILFDTGKATLRPESHVQINNIIEIMKAFPKVKIKIGGYTDNTGNAKANKKLSGDRAHAIQTALVKAGIGKGRLNAEGYGSEHPVASNDTPDGRQKNRRIDVNVTAK